MAHLLEVLTAVVAAVGVVIAVVQPVDFSWKKVTPAALGAVSAVIVIVDHTFFPAEYRAYNKVANPPGRCVISPRRQKLRRRKFSVLLNRKAPKMAVPVMLSRPLRICESRPI